MKAYFSDYESFFDVQTLVRKKLNLYNLHMSIIVFHFPGKRLQNALASLHGSNGLAAGTGWYNISLQLR